MVPSIARYHSQFNQTSVIYLYTVKSQNSFISSNSVYHKHAWKRDEEKERGLHMMEKAWEKEK